MKTRGTMAALSAAVFAAAAAGTLFAGGMQKAVAAECTGPFAKCAIEVGGRCERMPNGKMLMTCYDKGGYVGAFEECVGKVFEAHGRPNPYRPATSQKPAPKR